MDANTLIRSQLGYLSSERANALIEECNAAMILGDITTVTRAAMFLAQVGHESGSLRYQQEIQPPPGATYPPYIGRTFIQVTWEANYAAFGQWCHAKGLLKDPNQFVKNPASLADDRWAWYGAVWFWTTHNLNAYADHRDVLGATRVINGGTNGLDDREQRYRACLALGNALLPSQPKDNIDMDAVLNLLRAVLLGGKEAPEVMRHSHPKFVKVKGVLPRLGSLERKTGALQKQLAAQQKTIDELTKKVGK